MTDIGVSDAQWNVIMSHATSGTFINFSFPSDPELIRRLCNIPEWVLFRGRPGYAFFSGQYSSWQMRDLIEHVWIVVPESRRDESVLAQAQKLEASRYYKAADLHFPSRRTGQLLFSLPLELSGSSCLSV
jgi:hypothetical protein